MKNIEKYIIGVLVVGLLVAIGTAVYFGISVDKNNANEDRDKQEEVVNKNEIDASDDQADNKKQYTYENVAGKYVNLGDYESYIVLKSDGSWEGQSNECEGYALTGGTYKVENGKIILDNDEYIFNILSDYYDDNSNFSSILLKEELKEFDGGFSACSNQEYYAKSIK